MMLYKKLETTILMTYVQDATNYSKGEGTEYKFKIKKVEKLRTL